MSLWYYLNDLCNFAQSSICIYRILGKQPLTSLIGALALTLCVRLEAMSDCLSPEPYRANGCLLSLSMSLELLHLTFCLAGFCK